MSTWEGGRVVLRTEKVSDAVSGLACGDGYLKEGITVAKVTGTEIRVKLSLVTA
jgi:hypothetical protein